MTPLPISLCVFDSCKGHFQRTDIYRAAITALNLAAPLKSTFRNLLVHIKRGSNDSQEVLAGQISFYTQLGFQIIVTDGDFSHNSPTHQREYSRDLVRVYGDAYIQSTPYILHWESDWAPDPRGNTDFVDSLARGLAYLAARPHVMSLRFPRFLDEVNRLKGLKAKHNMDVEVLEETAAPFAGHFYRHNDNLSLNPMLARTRDMFWATRLLKGDFERMSGHVEMIFTQLMSAPAAIDGELPYAIFNPQDVGVLHWGVREGDEDKRGGVYAN